MSSIKDCTCLYQVYLSKEELDNPNRLCGSQSCPSNAAALFCNEQLPDSQELLQEEDEEKETQSTRKETALTSNKVFIEEAMSQSDAILFQLYRYRLDLRLTLASRQNYLLKDVGKAMRQETRLLNRAHLSVEEKKLIREKRDKEAELWVTEIRANPSLLIDAEPQQLPHKYSKDDEFIRLRSAQNSPTSEESTSSFNASFEQLEQSKAALKKRKMECENDEPDINDL